MYLRSTKFVKNATADAERKKLEAVAALFKKYGDHVAYKLVEARERRDAAKGTLKPVGR
jgi:hypothetical protein